MYMLSSESVHRLSYFSSSLFKYKNPCVESPEINADVITRIGHGFCLLANIASISVAERVAW